MPPDMLLHSFSPRKPAGIVIQYWDIKVVRIPLAFLIGLAHHPHKVSWIEPKSHGNIHKWHEIVPNKMANACQIHNRAKVYIRKWRIFHFFKGWGRFVEPPIHIEIVAWPAFPRLDIDAPA